jgi:hypothetical protein
LARSLTEFGNSAIPDLERALASIGKQGRDSKYVRNAKWLLLAYARISKADGFLRLQSLTTVPGLGFLQNDLDDALALSLGLTSYVSDSRPLDEVVRCRPQEPRDAMDLLILSWERRDQNVLQASLGATSRAEFELLTQGRTWADLRAALWPGTSQHAIGIGY